MDINRNILGRRYAIRVISGLTHQYTVHIKGEHSIYVIIPSNRDSH